MAIDSTTNRPLGWALIGCGSAGKSHAQWASSTPDIAIRGSSATLKPTPPEIFTTNTAARNHTTNPRERLQRSLGEYRIESQPSHSSHADLAVATLNANKHLYLEKPMAMTTADCLRIYQAMRGLPARNSCLNFSIRFSGASRAIKRRLKRFKGEPCAMYDGASGPQPMAMASRGGGRASLRCRRSCSGPPLLDARFNSDRSLCHGRKDYPY